MWLLLLCVFIGEEHDILESIRWGCSSEHHNTMCAIKRMDEIRDWLLYHSKYRILVTGKMGSGKTTFIRGLTEGFVPPSDNLLPHTIKVAPYSQHHEGSNCIFFDTPGLKDDENSANDYAYLKEMVQKNGEPNLLVFAVKMEEPVRQDEVKEALVNVSSAFGRKIWQKAMFILTFANLVQAIGHTSDSVANKLYVSKLVDEHHLNILHILRSISVKDEVINEIPVLPVGVVSKPILVADRLGQSWVESFWQEAFQILRKTQPTNSDILNLDNTYEAFTPQGNDIKSNSLSSLSIYFLFVFVSGFTFLVGIYMVYHEPGKVTVELPDQALVILGYLSTISSGIACHSLWDSIIAGQNDDIEQEKWSYLSLFLSFVYYIWFMATSGFTVNAILWIFGEKWEERVESYISKLFFVIGLAWSYFHFGNLIYTIFDLLIVGMKNNKEAAIERSYFSMLFLILYYCWFVAAFLVTLFILFYFIIQKCFKKQK